MKTRRKAEKRVFRFNSILLHFIDRFFFLIFSLFFVLLLLHKYIYFKYFSSIVLIYWWSHIFRFIKIIRSTKLGTFHSHCKVPEIWYFSRIYIRKRSHQLRRLCHHSNLCVNNRKQAIEPSLVHRGIAWLHNLQRMRHRWSFGWNVQFVFSCWSSLGFS